MLLTIIGIGLSVSLFMAVLSFGLQATMDDILYLFRRPRQLARALFSINVIMPIFAFFLVQIFTLDPVIEVALIALAVSPVPPVLPSKALKSGGTKSFTFGLLAAVSVLSIIMVPLVLSIFDRLIYGQVNFSEFAVVKKILISVFAPLVLGMIIRKFAPAFSERVAGPLGKFAMTIVILVFLPILLGSLPLIWSLLGNGTLLALAAFILAGITAGHFLGGPDPRDRTVLAIATASRHPAIAISLAVANVGETEAKLAFAAIILYLVVNAFVAAPYLKWLSGDTTQEDEKEATV